MSGQGSVVVRFGRRLVRFGHWLRTFVIDLAVLAVFIGLWLVVFTRGGLLW